jgi:hypothetical protein
VRQNGLGKQTPALLSRYFGKFQSREEAEKWIEKSRWLTEQTQELDEAQP